MKVPTSARDHLPGQRGAQVSTTLPTSLNFNSPYKPQHGGEETNVTVLMMFRVT